MSLGVLPYSFKIFAEEDLDEALSQRMNDLYNSIQQINRNKLLNANESELIESYVEEFTYKPVIINFDSITMSEREGYPEVIDSGELINQKYSCYTFHLEVTGELAVLKMAPNPRIMRYASFTFNGTSEISFEVFGIPEDIGSVVREKDSILDLISKQLMSANNQVKNHNQSVKDKVISIIQQRKEEILKQMGTISAIGVPLKKK